MTINTIPIRAAFDMIANATSPTMKAHDAKMAMMKTDPVLALALRIEAIGDGRICQDQILPSQLATIRQLARELVRKHTGKPFTNPLYPESCQ